jgi:predicted acyl esterase
VRRLLLVLVLALLAAAAPAAHSKEGRWAPERWQESLSEPVYDGVVRTTHHIEAEDGTSLSLTVHLPAGRPPAAKLPTLLEITPYRPLDQATDAYAENEFFVVRGAAYVAADPRGTGGSEGCLDFGGSADRADARVVAAWIRSQPWSNGRLVTDGFSHSGMGSVVAHAAVPGLTGAVAHAPVVSYHQDEWVQGAKLEGQLNGPLYQGIELAPPLPPEFADPGSAKAQAAGCTGRTMLDFSSVDGPVTSHWADRDLSRHVEQGRAPVLLTHGFLDASVHPDHSQLYWDALPDGAPKYAIFGWWTHSHPEMEGHAFGDYADVRHRWLDALLLRRQNGLFAEPRVLVEDSRGVWHEGRDWPLERSQQVVLHSAAPSGLTGRAQTPGAVSYADALGAQRGEWDGASVVFRTDPLPADRLVNGAPVLDLVASSSADATKWVAYLFAEAPDGTRRRVSHGYADSHTWDGESQWKPMQPGKTYRWQLTLQPTAVVVEKGSRLVLLIASQDSRHTDPAEPVGRCFEDDRGRNYCPSGIVPAATAGRAVNTVHTGAGKTALRLHWVDPRKTAKPPW